MTTVVINTQIGVSREISRIWLEGQKLASAGIKIGVRYMMNVQKALNRVELRPAPNDYQGKTFTVSKREKNNTISPLIEVRTEILETLFQIGTKIRVAIREGRIIVTESHIATKVSERVKRFMEKLKDKTPLAVTSLFHGGGVLDKAIHSGMHKAGVNSFVQVGVELEGEYIDASLRNNPELWTEESIVINSDIREINLTGNIPQCDFLIAGIPCTGASKAGRSKNKLSCAEEHSAAGSMFVDFLDWVKASNPGVVLIENVGEYATTSSMMVIRSVLTSLGYQLSETVLDGNDYGALEKRKRLCVVATTPGICDQLDFSKLVSMRNKESTLREILEDIPLDSDRWKSYDYLAAKEERDLAAGKGFARQLLTGDESYCGTIGKDYMKGRSTEPFIVHPADSALSRLFTKLEHARVKTIPESVVDGVSETVAHQILGQSVVFSVFEAVGYLIGLTVQGLTTAVNTIVDEAVSLAMGGTGSVRQHDTEPAA